MTMFKSVAKWLLVLVLAGVLVFVGVRQWQRFALKREAKAIHSKLETYRSTSKAYPPSLAEAGVANNGEGPIFYQKEPDGSYLLWYGTSLGESVLYSSRENDWSQ